MNIRTTPTSIILALVAFGGTGTLASCSSLPWPGEHAKYSIGGVTYVAPIVIKRADVFTDGGTLAVLLVDSQGQEGWFCNDGRMVIQPLSETSTEDFDKRPIYIGRHPSYTNARALPLGGSDEQELARMLQDWKASAQRAGGPRLAKGGDSTSTPDPDEKAQIATLERFIDYVQRHLEHNQKA